MTWEEQLAQWRSELELIDQLEGWVTAAEAVERSGVSRSALRSWYRSGQVRSRLVDGPHGPQRLVNITEVTARAERSKRIVNKLEQGRGLEATVDLLLNRVEELERQVGSLTQLLLGTNDLQA